jgi:hypothetical protein
MENEARPDLRTAWKNQPVEPVRISLDDIRRKARTLQRQVLRRNLLEYAAGVLVVTVFGGYIILFPAALARIGSVLIIAATLLVLFALHRRGSSRTLMEHAGMITCLSFHRQELERQRDLLRGVWNWYLLPFVPGIVIFHLGLFQFGMARPGAHQHAARFAAGIGLSLLVCLAFFAAIGALNMCGAHRLQSEIEDLDALGRNS